MNHHTNPDHADQAAVDATRSVGDMLAATANGDELAEGDQPGATS
jgi:hypothetical protein